MKTKLEQAYERLADRHSNDDRPRPWSPPMDVRLAEDEMVVFVDLPGVEADDVTVTLTGTDLYILGERAFADEEHVSDYVQVERMHGPFEGRVPLPKDALRDSVETDFECGILRVRVPIRG